MRKPGPGKRLYLLDVVEKFHELESARANLFHLRGLFDGVEVIAHMMNATTGWRDDIVEAGKISDEQRFGVGALRVEPGIRHRLPAAGLVAWVHDLVAEALKQLEGRNADLRQEGVDETWDEKTDAHGSLL